jgi:chromosome partitioning protein
MTVVISFINMKGGVGKTTISSLVAEFMAESFNYNVLLIDIDPQINATLFFIEENDWKEKDNNNETIATLFTDYIKNTNFFDIEKSLFKNIKRFKDSYHGFDLLPSSLKLGFIQEELIKYKYNSGNKYDPELIMKKKLSDRIKKYNFVIIDAPPNIGIITRNALKMSNYFIIPVIPDFLSTYGIDQLVSELKYTYSINIYCLGIVISRFRSNVTTHKKYLEILKTKEEKLNGLHVFNTVIKETVRLEDQPDLKSYGNYLKHTKGQLFGYDNLYNDIYNLTKEIIDKVNEYER